MCGIVGTLANHGEELILDELSRASDTLDSRGPDDSGLWAEAGVGLAHRRLAIQDLTSGGHQPMQSPDGRHIIVFNGEIYNFRTLRRELDWPWQGQSDTEVILAAYATWGADCLGRFIGMFAFAIWDRHEKSLFLARDRMGVKPLYYTEDKERFSFASRPRALTQLAPALCQSVDEQALRYYLELGYIPAPYSMHAGVKKLQPAHYLIWREGKVQIRRYWDYQHILPDPAWNTRHEEDLLDELEELATLAVRRRLISDVPLGAFLSGGIDSSLVVALMAKGNSASVKTFTIGFKESQYDESSHALAVADCLRTEHHCEFLGVDDLLQLIPTFHRSFDEPFFDYSAFPTMAVSRLARKHVTVSLSGDGGDEFFGGYHYYRIIQQLSHAYRLPKALRGILAESIALMPGHKFKLLSGALKQTDIAAAFAFSRSIAKDFGTVLTPAAMERTLSMKSLFSSESNRFPNGLEPAEMGMRLDSIFTLPDDYLQKVDLSSMAFSLESREPLLDHELIEWSMRLPLNWKIRGGVNKYLLRKLAYRYVRKDLLDRPKQGFSVPIDRWLRGPLKQWALERIQDNSLYERVPLVQSKVRELFDLHQSGRRNVHPLLWSVLMLLDFVANQNKVSQPQTTAH
jgi:asparagine synthase (glutamine-hydrolysing)